MINTLISQINYITFYILAQLLERKCYFYAKKGTIYDVVKNGKKYYKAQISLGYDKNGKRIRKCFCGYNKTEVLKKMQQALFKYGVSTYSYDNISFGDFFKDWLYNYKNRIKT